MIVANQSQAEALDSRRLQLAREALESEGRLDAIASQLGFSNEEEALLAVARTMGLEMVDLARTEVDVELLAGFPVKLIHRHNVLPLRMEDRCLVIATGNPFDVHALDAVGAATGQSVRAVLAVPSELAKLIRAHLGVGAETVEGLIAQQQEVQDVEILEEVDWDQSEAGDLVQEASVVRLVNEILSEAVEVRASDIHLESQAAGLKIRYRIDGVLQKQPMPPEMNRFQAAIISRLKIMARLNIAEKRVPQDGRIKLKVCGREIDLRLSIIPMLHGEGVVMRVLDKETMQFSLRGLGMDDDIYASFGRIIKQPHGIVLVTGPTGSGKTTTLYSALTEIKSEATKIITTEDPIEYQLEGINQIQVHAKVGLTFASSFRSVLRHDPDIVLVGEIRDLETAVNAVQASLTGHLVFSTLHTNDAAGSFMRLNDMGVEPFLVSSTIRAVMAQRLVRKLCHQCRRPAEPTADRLPLDFPSEQHARQGATIFEAVGCRACRNFGYSGRVGLYELLEANEDIRALAANRTATSELRSAAMKAGMRTLRQDGWLKVLRGETSVDEVLRITSED